MKWKTHLSFGIFLGLLYFDSIFWALVTGFFALVPDIDKFNSKISKKFRLLSIPFLLVPHRKLTHSVWFLGVSFLFFWNVDLFFASLIGINSHVILDGLTKGGVRPFYPFKAKVNFIFKTGSFSEYILFILFILGDILIIVM